MASTQEDESGDQDQNENQDQNQKPWLRIVPVPAGHLVLNLSDPPTAVREVLQPASREKHAWRRLGLEIPRPAGAIDEDSADAYAEGYEPRRGAHEDDTTEHVRGQTYAHENNLPRLLRLMVMARDHPEYQEARESKKSTKKKRKDEPEDLTDEEGNKVTMRVLVKGVTEDVQMKKNSILPRHISSQVEGWRMFMWIQYDPTITYRDIHARIRPQFRSRKKGKDGQESESIDESGSVYTYLSNRITMWIKSAAGGQFKRYERKTKTGKPTQSDMEIVKAHFASGPETVGGDDEMVAHFDSMARRGDLNKIYWNTPWRIYKRKGKDGKDEILVQQDNARVKDVYFNPDVFENDPRQRERVYMALWKSYFAKSERQDDEGEKKEDERENLGDYQRRNFDSILGMVERLEVEHRAIQTEVLLREDEDHNGSLDFAGNFAIANAREVLISTVDHMRDYGALMGLTEWWELEGLIGGTEGSSDNSQQPSNSDDTTSNHTNPTATQDIVAIDPIEQAVQFKETIASLYDELSEILLSWNTGQKRELRINQSMKRENKAGTTRSCLKTLPANKSRVIGVLARHFRRCVLEVWSLQEKFKKEVDSGSHDSAKTLDYANNVSQRIVDRLLSAIREQAEFLGVSSVYYLEPFANGITDTDKHNEFWKIFQTLGQILKHELEKHLKANQIVPFYKDIKTQAYSDQLRAESLEDFRKKKHDLEKKTGKSVKPSRKNDKAAGISKERHTRAATRKRKATDAATRTGTDSGTDSDMPSTTISFGVGTSPKTSYEALSVEELLNPGRLRQELERILRAHKLPHEIPKDIMSASDLIFNVVQAFPDVLGHYRISVPVLYILRNIKAKSGGTGKDKQRLVIAVDGAMEKTGMTRKSYVDASGDQNVANAVATQLRNNQERWATMMRAKLEWKGPRVVGDSPTDAYPHGLWLKQEIINPELDNVLRAHGMTEKIPEDKTLFHERLHHVLTELDFHDVLGHNRIAMPIINHLKEAIEIANDDEIEDEDPTYVAAQSIARDVYQALRDVGYLDKALNTGTPGAFFNDVADQLDKISQRWIQKVREQLRSRNGIEEVPTGNDMEEDVRQSEERTTDTGTSQTLGNSPTTGGYSNLHLEDGTLDRAKLNHELNRVLDSHEYRNPNFPEDEGFETRIQRVLHAGFVDVLGHYRILAPIVHILRTTEEDAVVHQLAFAVQDAVRNAGYMVGSLENQEPEDPDSKFYHALADKLEEVQVLWTSQVRFTLRNNEEYAKAHPKDPRPKERRKLFG
ncbi:uncharacterized protein IWZ02DRAFT_520057 [Phyllosticta citriasiana]